MLTTHHPATSHRVGPTKQPPRRGSASANVAFPRRHMTPCAQRPHPGAPSKITPSLDKSINSCSIRRYASFGREGGRQKATEMNPLTPSPPPQSFPRVGTNVPLHGQGSRGGVGHSSDWCGRVMTPAAPVQCSWGATGA
jgi:hypothetical protein